MHATRHLYGEVPLRRAVPLRERQTTTETMPWGDLSLEDITLAVALVASVLFSLMFVFFVFVA